MLLLLVFTTFSGTVAVQWTSSSILPNGSLVQACIGDNISLPWDFNMTSPQRIFIEWFKDQEETILAFYFRGVFVPSGSLSPHIDFIPNAGIILPMATLSDAGYYRVKVNFRGDPQIYVQGAFVHVSEAPVTIDGGLHAYILPKSVYQKTTGQWHLQLGCGTFLSLGQPSVSVKWNTPSREIINSTSYDNGVFILTVSNPVEDGVYSCFLERISTAVLCLHNQSSMNRAATVDVKGVHTRISLLEGGLEALREETVNLTVPVSDLEDLVHKLETNNKIFEKKIDILQDTIFNITTENKELRHEVERLESIDRNTTDLMQENNRNISSMVHDFINQMKDFKGLANLHNLTRTVNVTLRVDLTDFDGVTAYAVYKTFSITDAHDNYRLNVGGYTGTAGDSLANHNKMQFSTFDRDHDQSHGTNCAQYWQGAWWYNDCHYSHLNGLYKSNGIDDSYGVSWYYWKSNRRSLKRVEMKIKQ